MSGRSELDGMLRELAQQQSALSQQQTALLQLQAESLRLQHLLIERAMGEAPAEEVAPVTAAVNADRGAPKPIVESPHAEMAVRQLVHGRLEQRSLLAVVAPLPWASVCAPGVASATTALSPSAPVKS